HGRMGRALVGLAGERPDMRVVGGIGHDAPAGETGQTDIPVVEMAAAAEVIEGCDVVVDFSTADATAALVSSHAAALAGRGLVVGTTGLAAETEQQLDELAASAAVL